MLDIGSMELLVVAVLALVVVGPRELPAIIRGLGKALGTLRNLTAELKAAASGLVSELDREANGSSSDPEQASDHEIKSSSEFGERDGAAGPTLLTDPEDDPFAELRAKEGITPDMTPEQVTRKIMENREKHKKRDNASLKTSVPRPVNSASDLVKPDQDTLSEPDPGKVHPKKTEPQSVVLKKQKAGTDD